MWSSFHWPPGPTWVVLGGLQSCLTSPPEFLSVGLCQDQFCTCYKRQLWRWRSHPEMWCQTLRACFSVVSAQWTGVRPSALKEPGKTPEESLERWQLVFPGLLTRIIWANTTPPPALPPATLHTRGGMNWGVLAMGQRAFNPESDSVSA